jgi:hypothetical protein
MARNEIIKSVGGNSYDFVPDEFRVDDVPTDLAAFLNGSTYDLPAGYYVSQMGFNWGANNVNLIDQDGCYTFETKCLIGTSTYGGHVSTTGKLFDIANGATFFAENAAFVAPDVGDLNAFSFVTLKTVAMPQCGDGLTLTNIVSKITGHVLQWNNGLNTGGQFIEIAGTTPPILELDGIDSQPKSNEAFILIASGWSGDAIINTGVHSTTSGGPFFNASGLDQTDVDVVLDNVRNVSNSAYFASATLGTVHSSGVPIDNTEETIIAATATPVKVAVNTGVANEEWRTVGLERFTLSADGRVTYVGKEDIGAGVSAVVTIDPVGGGTDNMGVYIAKNGVVLDDSLGKASGSTESQLGSVDFIPLSTNDYLEIFVANFSDTSNLVVATGKFTVNG